jgi:glycosyltransferase involved in cell wall biosynthesis
MNSQKTICFFTTYFIPHLGGIENYTFNLAKSLFEKGYKVIVVTTNTEKLSEKDVVDGIIIYRLPIFHFTRERFPIVKPTLNYFSLIKELTKENLDIAIINTRFYLLSITGLILSTKLRIPAVMIEHSAGHFSVSNKVLDKLGEIYEHGITWIIKSFKPHFYGNSKAGNQWLKHFGISSNGILYNGIDSTYRIRDSFDFRNQFNLTKDTLLITFLGRLIEEKGVLEFIKAANELKKDLTLNAKYHFFIAGSGPLDNYIDKSLKKDEIVSYLGSISVDQLVCLLDQTDIFVFPTNMPEGLPTILLEAGLSKCAVITTDRGGCTEIIPDNTYGIIIKNNSYVEIRDAIINFLDNPGYRESASHKLYEKVIHEFTWAQLSSNFIEQLKI